jgi:hypothetical protein
MLVTRDGRHAVIADPDRDRVLAVDIASGGVVADVALSDGDEPGRVVEDGAGRVHVALRRGGDVITLAPNGWAVVARRVACAEPRGLAWSTTDDTIHVACTSGELVTFPAAGGPAIRRLQLDRDLRDVVVAGTQLVVTRFRTAELITLDAQGVELTRTLPPNVSRFDFDPETGVEQPIPAIAAVAWRAIGLPDGRVVVTHQRQRQTQLRTRDPGGYGVECDGGAVENALAVMQPGQSAFAVSPQGFGVLPVDIAVSPAGDRLAIALAGSHFVHTMTIDALAFGDQQQPCPVPIDRAPAEFDDLGAPTAIAYGPDSGLVVFYPEVPALVVHSITLAPRTIMLPGGVGYDAGRELFHTPTAVGLACASCHPEARDDGLIWDFAEFGVRRTQTLAGNILDRAPYHWNGDQADLSALLSEVFVSRMSGHAPTGTERASLGPWLDRVPAPAPIAGDPAAIARGQALFESSAACATCHNGPLLTNNSLSDVGTGGLFKVPSLRGIAARAPFLHSGCAPTLLDRLVNPCGGGDQHGRTSQLSAGELADLVAYLESL